MPIRYRQLLLPEKPAHLDAAALKAALAVISQPEFAGMEVTRR